MKIIKNNIILFIVFISMIFVVTNNFWKVKGTVRFFIPGIYCIYDPKGSLVTDDLIPCWKLKRSKFFTETARYAYHPEDYFLIVLPMTFVFPKEKLLSYPLIDLLFIFVILIILYRISKYYMKKERGNIH